MLASDSPPSSPLTGRAMAMSLVVEFGEHLFQRIVVTRSKEGERRGQRAGADACHQVEFRAIAALGPAGENAGTEGAVRTAAGNSQEADDRPATLPGKHTPRSADLGPLLLGHGVDIGRRHVAPEADGLSTHADDGGIALQPQRDRITRQRRRAGGETYRHRAVPDKTTEPPNAHQDPSSFGHV